MERSECEAKAEEVRAKYNPTDLSPFPYQNVADQNTDLAFHFHGFVGEALKNFSGAITFDAARNQFDIHIKDTEPKTRQHFTLAHELGHYFLHKDLLREDGIIVDGDSFYGNRALFRDSDQINLTETEANQFAAALIMPADLVRSAWKELGGVEECAKVFNVSASAMSIRLEKLGILSV